MRRLLALLFCLVPLAAAAEDRATLIADSVAVQSGSVLVASGHVEVFYLGQHLLASAITYDQSTDRLAIEGPIRIDDGKGSLFVAAEVDLRADLTEGILTSARVVLNQQLQLAAAQVVREDGGNLTAMRHVVASSCTICAGNPTPLWEIRARSVIHDAAAQQIYFSDAALRFYGFPVIYLPVLRVPDPTLTRATGFLTPRLRSTSALGAGLKLPYFITMGDSRDALVTPYFTTRGDFTLGLRYRQAFTRGQIEVSGAYTADDLGPVHPRGYLEATGAFDLGNAYKLTFHGITVSDRAYLLDYGISDTDRLDSRIELSRVQRNLYFSARLIGFQSLREGESNRSLPSVIADLTFHRRFKPALLGGEGEFQLQSYSALRPSTSLLDGNGDGIADGRDLGRLTLRGTWQRNWTLDPGILVAAQGDVTADFYAINQDPAYDGRPARVTGTAAVELRWPWVRANAAGVSQMITPVIQLVAAPQPDGSIPNEDSTLVEFDESNLFSLNRFPGSDDFEGGSRANLGVNYLRFDPRGWTLGVTVGRVVRPSDLGQFSAASGLAGQKSDWLLAWGVQDLNGLSLTSRVLLDDDLGLTKGELRLDFARPGYGVAAGYEYLLADPVENRPDPLSELVLDARYDLTRNWRARVTTRYDLIEDRAATAGLELTFRNECVDFDLSLSRRYTTSTSVKPTTDFGISIELLGFGGGAAAGPAKVCRR